MGGDSGMFHGGAGDLNAYPARGTFAAISAEAGIASKAIPTTYAATSALMTIYNTSLSSDGNDNNRVLKPRLLTLTANTVNTGATDLRLHFYMDNKDRRSSGGTELTAQSTSFSDSSGYADVTPKAEIFFGDITAHAAGSDEKVLWRSYVKDEIFAIGESVTIVFGANGPGQIDTAGLADMVRVVPPMVIGPGQTLIIHEVISGAQSVDADFQVNFWYEEGNFPLST